MSELQGTAAQRYRILRAALEQFSCEPADLNGEQQQEVERIVARQLQIEAAVLSSPEAVGVVINEAQVQGAWQEICSRYEDPAALEQTMERHGFQQADLFELLSRELRVEAVLERVSADVQEVTDADAQQYYERQAARFHRPEARAARHILITINPDYPENTREAALSRIQQIEKRLRKKIDRFGEQALKHSECPTAMENGMLGKVVPGKLYPELEEHLFKLKEGELSGVVESPLGFHILVCDRIVPARVVSFEEALPKLREALQGKLRQMRQREWIAQCLQKKENTVAEDVVHG